MQEAGEVAVGARGLRDEPVELLEEAGDDGREDGAALLLVVARLLVSGREESRELGEQVATVGLHLV